MNKKLQNILEIIQQSEKLDAEQKENLLKAVKDADKELEITAFKLERTEKVKKTTAILLEETIEELEQKRKSVEDQNRELEIEASLERVRAVAMSMNKSEDLLGICEVSFKEFKKLGFDDIRNALINIPNDDKRYFMDYDFSDLTGGEITRIEYGSHPVVEDYLKQIRSAKDAFYQGVIKEDQLEEWKNFRKNSGQIDDPRLDKATALYYYFFSIGMGGIGISTLQPIDESQIKILKRFRNVFDLAYKRFNDIALAEAQAREGQIQLALEKVRTVALGLNKSEEMLKVAKALYEQLLELGFSKIRNAIIDIKNGDDDTFTDYDYSHEMSGTITQMSYHDDPTLEGQFKKMATTTEDFFELVLEGKELEDLVNMRLKNGEAQDPRLLNIDLLSYNLYSFGNGAIGISNFGLLTAEEKSILNRFSNVFTFAYKRYTDLASAEVQAREAIKQTSLDRVRGEIASMRTAEDLNRITPIIWRELKTLEVPFIRCGVFIVEEITQSVQVYLTTPDGKSLGVLNLSFDSNEITSNTVKHWNKKQIFKQHWNKEDFIKWTKSMMKTGQVQNEETYQGSTAPPESLYLHFVPFAQGMLYVGDVNPLTDEKLELVKTLAEAFSIAFARYEDFKNLEEAKNKIEITLSELKSAQAQLIHSEKMASLGELTAGIAHEIKNPLNFVNNFSEVSRELLDEMKSEIENKNIDEVIELIGDLKQNLEKINQHGKRADSIVKGMLLHSRGTSGEKTPTDINDLLDQYVNLAYHGMRATNKDFNITIEKDYDETLNKINVVPQDISRVFLNIINNACYAAYDKKKKGENNFSPVLKVSTKNLHNQVEIRIKDNGNGVTADHLDKIFQPFFTTKPTGEGTGLGLSLSYDIVTKIHGGDIKFETKEGEFTEFIITLPKINEA